MSDFKRKFRKAAGGALVGLGAFAAGSGIYHTGVSVSDHFKSPEAYNEGMVCKRKMDAGKACTLEETQKAVFYLNNSRQMTQGVLDGLFVAPLLLGWGASTYRSNRKKPDDQAPKI